MARLDSIQVNYAREFTRLSLWYVHRQLNGEETDFEHVLNRQVNIYRNTSLYDGERHPSNEDVGAEWNEVVAQLRAIFARHLDLSSTAQLEEEGLVLLWPYLEAHLLRGGTPMPLLEERPYECWSYDFRNDQINIHIANLYQPRSPLSDMKIPFAASLIRLLLAARAQRPEIDEVHCSSWLNSLPAFLALFPASWKQNEMPKPEVHYTLGQWGQFMDRRGDFHARNGTRFRELGEFPFPCMSCAYPVREALAHLEESFPAAVEYNERKG